MIFELEPAWLLALPVQSTTYIFLYNCSSLSDLNAHLDEHKIDKRLYICELCNARYADKSGLKSHIFCVHEGQKKFECELCPSKGDGDFVLCLPKPSVLNNF